MRPRIRSFFHHSCGAGKTPRYTRLDQPDDDMAQDRASSVVQMHAEFDTQKEKDAGGGTLISDEKPAPLYEQELGGIDEDGSEYPTQEELDTLRHIPYTLHPRTWLVCVIELCERFCYYGVSGIFNNYISHSYGSGPPYTGDDLPGAIGRGQLANICFHLSRVIH